uniref:FI20184p1 n=1 Tax=Drosophila melanogaster TaxID=7227 RepID=E1JI73_DROME|eukprot:NP_001163385.1 Z band alternatively spliced PDZ-motif protein 66, isoform N [Drosophila melanogaster]
MTTSRSSASASFSRPAFWKVPGYELPTSYRPQPTPKPPLVPLPSPCRRRSSSGLKKRVHFADEQNVGVQVGSPAHGELLRGDIISKIGEYDARDLSHADAQQLFRGAGNEIRLVVHRDNKIAYTQGATQEAGPGSRSNSTLPPVTPDLMPHRGPSPFLPGPSHFERALQLPVDTLPQTVFPQLNSSGGYEVPSTVFSPKPTRDHQQDVDEEQAAIVNQPYRTTPLVLPGAKVKKDAPTTESYLRHYPNPAVRAHPGHDYHDSIMKQRVADTMLHKVVGSEADTGRVFHKQFNSPIGLYSNNNIEDTIRSTVPYKKTVQYDPRNSETYRAIQEEGGYSNYGQSSPQEVTIPVQTKVYQPNRLVPGKKPVSAPVSRPPYNVVNTHDENIRQSGSFNRLMYSVIGATEY